MNFFVNIIYDQFHESLYMKQKLILININNNYIFRKFKK